MKIRSNINNKTHPGEHLEDELKARGINQSLLSEASGIPKTIINEIIKGKRGINAEYAVRLEVALEIDAEFWMTSQADYELAIARHKLNKIASK